MSSSETSRPLRLMMRLKSGRGTNGDGRHELRDVESDGEEGLSVGSSFLLADATRVLSCSVVPRTQWNHLQTIKRGTRRGSVA